MPNDVSPREPVPTEESERQPQKRAYTSLGHHAAQSTALGCICCKFPATVTSPLQKPTEAAHGVEETDASHHLGSLADWFLVGQRSAAVEAG